MDESHYSNVAFVGMLSGEEDKTISCNYHWNRYYRLGSALLLYWDLPQQVFPLFRKLKNLNATTLVLILLAVSVSGFSQKRDDGSILFGRHYSFILKEPAGWILDSEKAKSQDLQAVLYREGTSWKDAVAVMYARVIYKDETQGSMQKVISNDIADFLKLSKESRVSDSPMITTRDKKEAIVKVFYDAANKNHESVAFIDEPKVVVILVLSSRDKVEYEKSLPAFKALVGSYFFFAPLIDPR
jgi:hypothetical protein